MRKVLYLLMAMAALFVLAAIPSAHALPQDRIQPLRTQTKDVQHFASVQPYQYSQQPSPENSLRPNQQSQYSQQPAPETPLRLNKVSADWALVWVTVAIGVVGILQLSAFTWQAVKMGQTVFEMRRANKNAEEALLASERPWVGIEDIRIPALQANQRPNVLVVVKNFGKAPALEVVAEMRGLIRASDQEPPPVPSPMGDISTAAVLMPNALFYFQPFQNHIVLSQQQIIDINNGVDTLWLTGCLAYKDGRDQTHLTTFHTQYNPTLTLFAGSRIPGSHIAS